MVFYIYSKSFREFATYLHTSFNNPSTSMTPRRAHTHVQQNATHPLHTKGSGNKKKTKANTHSIRPHICIIVIIIMKVRAKRKENKVLLRICKEHKHTHTRCLASKVLWLFMPCLMYNGAPRAHWILCDSRTEFVEVCVCVRCVCMFGVCVQVAAMCICGRYAARGCRCLLCYMRAIWCTGKATGELVCNKFSAFAVHYTTQPLWHHTFNARSRWALLWLPLRCGSVRGFMPWLVWWHNWDAAAATEKESTQHLLFIMALLGALCWCAF